MVNLVVAFRLDDLFCVTKSTILKLDLCSSHGCKNYSPVRNSGIRNFLLILFATMKGISLFSSFAKLFSSASFGSNLIESSISLNRFSQPINKIIQNKRAPGLMEQLSQTAQMHYTQPDYQWRLESNVEAQLDVKEKFATNVKKSQPSRRH